MLAIRHQGDHSIVQRVAKSRIRAGVEVVEVETVEDETFQALSNLAVAQSRRARALTRDRDLLLSAAIELIEACDRDAVHDVDARLEALRRAIIAQGVE